MQTGSLDAAVTSSTSLISFRLEEISKAITSGKQGSFWFMFEPLLISKTVYDALPAAHQKAIDEVGLEMEKFGLEAAKADDDDLAKVYAKVGVTAKTMDAEAIGKWKALAQATAWKDFAERKRGLCGAAEAGGGGCLSTHGIDAASGAIPIADVPRAGVLGALQAALDAVNGVMAVLVGAGDRGGGGRADVGGGRALLLQDPERLAGRAEHVPADRGDVRECGLGAGPARARGDRCAGGHPAAWGGPGAAVARRCAEPGVSLRSSPGKVRRCWRRPWWTGRRRAPRGGRRCGSRMAA